MSPKDAREEAEAPGEDGAIDLLEIALLPTWRAPVEGILVGRVASVREVVRVVFPGCPDPAGVPARSMIQLEPGDESTDVALMFELGDPLRPCVLGRMMSQPGPGPAAPEVRVSRDGDRVVLAAEQEIVLQCGEASITLTRAGKVLIRGAYVLSASSGVNRVLGASVEIN
jgi:hypothetical protein